MNEIIQELIKKLREFKTDTELRLLDVESKQPLKGDPGESIKGDKGDDGYTPIKGVDYFDGKDGKNGRNGRNGSPDTPIEIKVKLETLEGEKRLDASAIKNLPVGGNSYPTYIQGLTVETDPIWIADKPDYLTTSDADSTYLKLDASNDPITGDLQVNANFGIGVAPTHPLDVKAVSSASSLAANIVVNGGFTGNANGWALGLGGGNPDWFYLLNTVRHNNGGGTAPLTPTTPLTIEAGAPYLVTFRVSGWVSGNVTPSLGDANGWPVTGNTVGAGSIDTQVIVASTTGNFALTPSSDFQGVVDNVVVRKITPTTPTIKIYDSNEASSLELRASFASNANTFLGIDSGLNAGTTASYNIGIGSYALNRLTSGRDNIAIGYYALYYNTTGINNTALGSGALGLNTTGFYNFAAGSGALANNTSGTYNWAGGDSAMFSNITGSINLAAGEYALYANTTGSYNTILGPEAFATGNGSYNVGIGFQAGIYETGSYKLYIDSTGSLTPLIYGEFDTKLFRINGHQEIIGNADVKQLIVKANATQTANLQEWQNSSGGVIGLFSPIGTFSHELSGASTGYSLTGTTTNATIFSITGTTTSNLGLAVNISPVLTKRNTIGIYQVPTFSPTVSGTILIGNVITAGVSNCSTNSTDLVGALYYLQTAASYTGLITNGNALQIDPPIILGSQMVTNIYGLRIYNQGVSGTTLSAGVYIEDQSGSSSNYAIYTNLGDVRLGGDTYWDGSGSGLLFGEIYVKDNVSTQSITNGANVKITAFASNGESNGLTNDAANDQITATKTGKYKCTVTGVLGGDASVVWNLAVGTSTSVLFDHCHTHHNFTGTAERQTLAMTGIIALTANDNVALYASHDGVAAKDILVEDITLTLELIGG